MFIAALFTIAKILNQLRCSPMDNRFKMWCICTMQYYSALKKNEITSFEEKWMELEIIILSEISQIEKAKYHMFSLICRIYL
jgi:hypothetical protein